MEQVTKNRSLAQSLGYEVKLFFGLERISRYRYLTFYLYAFSLCTIAVIIFAELGGSVFLDKYVHLCLIVPVLFNLKLLVQRLHDIGRSIFSLIWFIVPILSLFVMFLFMCWPGQSDANRYGQPPEPNTSGTHAAFAGALLTTVLLVVLILATDSALGVRYLFETVAYFILPPRMILPTS